MAKTFKFTKRPCPDCGHLLIEFFQPYKYIGCVGCGRVSIAERNFDLFLLCTMRHATVMTRVKAGADLGVVF